MVVLVLGQELCFGLVCNIGLDVPEVLVVDEGAGGLAGSLTIRTSGRNLSTK